MSITSCPQCGKQVTIPSGVATSVKVRCPLCQSQYALADALVNMPPHLELVDEGSTAKVFDADAPVEPASEGLDDLDILEEPVGDDGALAPLDPEAQVEDDDLTVEEKDTDVEELDAPGEQPIVRQAEADADPLEMVDSVEDAALDFEDALAAEVPAEEGPAASEPDVDMSLEFDEPAGEPSEAGQETQLDDELAPATSGDAGEFAFDALEPQAANEGGPALDSGEEEILEPSAGDEEIGIDFGDAIEPDAAAAAVAPVTSVEQVASDAKDSKAEKKKKKKDKKKKPKAEKSADARPRRSMSIVLGAVVALPLTLYGLLWLGPDYDFIGLGPMLPEAMVPASFNKRTFAAKPAIGLPQTVPAQVPPAAVDTNPPASAAVDEAPAIPPGTPLADEPVAPAADDPLAAPADDPAEMPAETPEPAENEDPLADAPARNPSGDVPAEPASTEPEPDVAPTPDELPADDPTVDLADDPFAPDVAPEPAPEEMPDEPAPAAADDVTDAPPSLDAPSLDTPATDAPEPAVEPPDASDDPFAPAATEPEMPNELPSPFDEPAPEPAPEPADEPLGPSNAAVVTPAALAEAIRNAQTADQQIVAARGTAPEAEYKKLRSNFYLSFFRLADAVTFAKDDSGSGQLDAMRQQLEQLVRQFAADSERVNALKFNAGRWLEFSRRTTPGVMLPGRVQSTQEVGRLHELKFEIGLAADASTVTVLTDTDPGLSPGDEAIVLGTIIDDPGDQVAGYEGNEPTVVWNGMLVRLPASQ